MQYMAAVRLGFSIIAFASTSALARAQDTAHDRGLDRYTMIRGILWSPNGKEIVFATNRGYENSLDAAGARQEVTYLWRIGVDGKGLRQITFPNGDTHHNDSNPHWSPDGRKIAFDSNRVLSEPPTQLAWLRQIFICDPDGRNLSQLTKGQGSIAHREPAWSPDGRRLAWVTNGPYRGGVAIGTVDGKEVGWLPVSIDDVASHPSWTKGGTEIVYKSDQNVLGSRDVANAAIPPQALFVRSAQVTAASKTPRGKPKTVVTSSQHMGLTAGVCSPRASILAFIARSDPSADLWTSNLDGSGLRQVTRLRDIGLGANWFVHPAWSHDGKSIAFVDRFGRALPPNVLEDGIWILNTVDGSVTEVQLPAVFKP